MGMREAVLEITRQDEKRGERRGLNKAKRLGEAKTKLSVARKMKSLGVSMDIISECTGLSHRRLKTI